MSLNEWEQGVITLPSAAWAGFKSSLRVAWNAHQDRMLARAQQVYDHLIAAAAGQRSFDWDAETRRIECGLVIPQRSRGHSMFSPSSDTVEDYYVLAEMFPAGRVRKPGAAGRPLKPTRKMFPHATGATKEFRFRDAAISLSEATKSVDWSVQENNHAVRDARAHPVGRAFFELLRRIKWTSRTGGLLTYSNEIIRHERHEGGGANQVSDRFGAEETRYNARFNTPSAKGRSLGDYRRAFA